MNSFLPDNHDGREDVGDYLGECQAVDHGLGILYEELKLSGHLENTLIFLPTISSTSKLFSVKLTKSIDA